LDGISWVLAPREHDCGGDRVAQTFQRFNFNYEGEIYQSKYVDILLIDLPEKARMETRFTGNGLSGSCEKTGMVEN
jgi:hypothetical protein